MMKKKLSASHRKDDSRNNDRPRLEPFYDRKKLLFELIPITLLIIIFAIAFYTYPKLPDKIPVHWNAYGEIDNYSSKLMVFLIPVIYLFFVIISFVLPAADVFKDNIKKFYKYFYGMKILFGIFFLVLFISTLLPNFGFHINISQIVIASIAVLFFIIGMILPKTERNYFIGIRTPWTLASDDVWKKTHVLGGRLFIVIAVLLIIGFFVLDSSMLYILFIILLVLLVIYLMYYSYMLYKKERSK